MDWSTVIGAVSAALALLIREGVAWWRAGKESRRAEAKQQAEVSIPANEQALRAYRELYDLLKKDTATLTEGMHHLDELLLQCREDKLNLKGELAEAKRQLDAFKARIAELNNPQENKACPDTSAG